MSDAFVFRRPELARRVAEVALGRDPFESTAGTFLAAPRRTGKSTFLTNDLLPELEARGAVPVYVDLWADRSVDPASLLMEAIREAARARQGRLAKAVRGSGLSKVGVGAWLSVDLDRLGAPGGPTLAAGLRNLIASTGKPVVLVVDEAQHAITTEAGRDAMFALKSARDTINIQPGGDPKPWLGLVFTGSNRDKLASLVTGRAQPFFGSSVTGFPLLGYDYAAAYASFVNGRVDASKRLEADETYEAFRVVGHRPQLLQAAVKDHVLGLVGDGHGPSTLLGHAEAARERYWSEFDTQWASLTVLQRAVLSRMISEGEGFRPFDAAGVAAYSAEVGRPVSPTDAQSALDALRDKGMVVRLERGRYTTDDPGMAEWHAARFRRILDDENDGGDGSGGGMSGGPG